MAKKEGLLRLVKDNFRLRRVISIVNQHKKLQTYWVCSNIMTVDRLGMNDHGPRHVSIISKHALDIMHKLSKAGVKSSLVENFIENKYIKDYSLTDEDAAVVVFLSCCLHDIGNCINRENHHEYNLLMASNILDDILDQAYGPEESAILKSEVLHAIVTNNADKNPLTVESSIVRVADALDMGQGRAKIVFNNGHIDVHKISALSINEVYISSTKSKPVVINIKMDNASGLFQITELLKEKIEGGLIQDFVRIVATSAQDVGGQKKFVIDF